MKKKIHSLDSHLTCFQVLVIVNKASMNVLLVDVNAAFCWVYNGLEWLGNRVGMWFAFLGTAK